MVVTAQGDTLQCRLKLTRKVSEGLLQITHDGVRSRILTVKEVRFFSYFDEKRKYTRVFHPVILQVEEAGKPHPVFTETIYSNERYAIVVHRTMGYSSENIQINPFRKKTVVDHLYKIDKIEKTSVLITAHDALNLLEQEAEAIRTALNQPSLKLRSLTDYLSVVSTNQKIL